MAILPAVAMLIVEGAPSTLVRPVVTTSAAAYPEGGTKKSVALIAVPIGVPTRIRPDPAFAGTAVVIWVLVALLAFANTVLNRTWFLLATVSKFDPLIVTTVPATPIVGVNELIVGPTMPAVTVKLWPLAAVLTLTVTEIVPVAAPLGTVTVSRDVVAAVTTAVVPLNLTVLRFAVALNPLPESMTVVPTGPLLGVNSDTDSSPAATRLTEVIFPAAS